MSATCGNCTAFVRRDGREPGPRGPGLVGITGSPGAPPRPPPGSLDVGLTEGGGGKDGDCRVGNPVGTGPWPQVAEDHWCVRHGSRS